MVGGIKQESKMQFLEIRMAIKSFRSLQYADEKVLPK